MKIENFITYIEIDLHLVFALKILNVSIATIVSRALVNNSSWYIIHEALIIFTNQYFEIVDNQFFNSMSNPLLITK